MRIKLAILSVLLGSLVLALWFSQQSRRQPQDPGNRQVKALPSADTSIPKDLAPEVQAPSADPTPVPTVLAPVTTAASSEGSSGPGDQFSWAIQRFLELDRDGDGLLSEKEMPEDLRLERAKWDTNGDGRIDFNEWTAFVRASAEPPQPRPAETVMKAPSPPPPVKVAKAPPTVSRQWKPGEFRRGITKATPGGSADPAPGGRKGSPKVPLDLAVDPGRDIIVYRAGHLPANLPPWFAERDLDGDGQIAYHEWKEKGGTLGEFRNLDLNGDGFITVEELILAGQVTVSKKAAPAPAPEPTPPPKPDAIPNPGNMSAFAGQIGKTIYVEVTGMQGGGIWGTDFYTLDSSIASAAVHAGILAPGQKGVIKVTVLADQGQYTGTARNGVTSGSWGAFGGSYSLEAVP